MNHKLPIKIDVTLLLKNLNMIICYIQQTLGMENFNEIIIKYSISNNNCYYSYKRN